MRTPSASASSSAFTPLCHRCSEPILESEEIVPTPNRHLFHRRCFVCSQIRCGSSLSLGDFGVHHDMIYCPSCFVSQMLLSNGNGKTAQNGPSPKEGKNNNNSNHNGVAHNHRNHAQPPYEHQLRTLQLGEDEEDDVEDEHEEDEEGGMLEVRKRMRCPSPIPEDDEEAEEEEEGEPPTEYDPFRQQHPLPQQQQFSPISATLRNPPWHITSGTRNASPMPLRPANCNRCTQRVFEAEKVVAASKVWHKRCFRCAQCARSIEPGKFSDHCGDIFCNSCYAKQFGPKGVGCGVGAGILQMHQ